MWFFRWSLILMMMMMIRVMTMTATNGSPSSVLQPSQIHPHLSDSTIPSPQLHARPCLPALPSSSPFPVLFRPAVDPPPPPCLSRSFPGLV